MGNLSQTWIHNPKHINFGSVSMTLIVIIFISLLVENLHNLGANQSTGWQALTAAKPGDIIILSAGETNTYWHVLFPTRSGQAQVQVLSIDQHDGSATCSGPVRTISKSDWRMLNNYQYTIHTQHNACEVIVDLTGAITSDVQM
jgi:hypothetical protein